MGCVSRVEEVVQPLRVCWRADGFGVSIIVDLDKLGFGVRGLVKGDTFRKRNDLIGGAMDNQEFLGWNVCDVINWAMSVQIGTRPPFDRFRSDSPDG